MILALSEVWAITNRTAYSHPFHLHGFDFRVLDANGEPRQPLAYKGTVDVPPLSQLQLAPRFDDRSGQWMLHGRILDPAELGMMNRLELSPE